MRTKVTRDGEKNAVVLAWGRAEKALSPTAVLDPENLKACRKIKLDQIVFTIQSGLTIFLHWSKSGLILPLEGRGLLNYYPFDSLQPDEDGEALTISAEGTGCFHLVLDMTKQR